MIPRESDNRPIIAAYLMGGAALGGGEPLLTHLLEAAGWRGNVALLLTLLLGFPTLVVLLGFSRPRVGTIVGGALLAALAWLVANLIVRSGRPLPLAALLLLVAPTAALLAIRVSGARMRSDAHHCRACGYPLHGLRHPRCPECGTPFERR